jgi:hypothetical protein
MTLHRPVRSGARLPITVPLLTALALGVCAAVALAAASPVAASGAPLIYPSIPTGAVGTRLTLSITMRSDVGPNDTFDLRYTTTDPVQDGCTRDHSHSLPGINPVKLSQDPQAQAPNTVTFTWPSTLGSNLYYFCLYPAPASATPGTGATPTPTQAAAWPTGEIARSAQPFAVTRDATPTLTITGADGSPVGTPIPLYTPLSVIVANWRSADHTPPSHLWIVSPDGSNWPELQFMVKTPHDSANRCTLSVNLSQTISASDSPQGGGVFLLAGGAGIYQASVLFLVAEPLAPTATSIPVSAATQTSVTSGHHIQGDVGSPLIVLFGGLMVLIALGLVATVIALAMRGRAEGRRREMRQMGLDVEPLEPAGMRDAPRPGMRQDTSRWDERGWDQRSR